MAATPSNQLDWWNSLRHGGLLLDPTRLSSLLSDAPESLSRYEQDRLRRRIDQFIDSPETHRNKFVAFVMEQGLAFHGLNGYWQRGSEVSKDWSRKAITGESIRPQHLWTGTHKSLVPVFIDNEQRLGLGRGKRVVSHALQWLRQTDNRLAVITNGTEWRIVFAGLDYDAFCQWEINQWFTEGTTSAEFNGLRSLLNQRLWTKPAADASTCLLSAINDSRKGQAELSQVLGERVRQAVELLIQGHGPVLSAQFDTLDPAEIYRAGVRIIMRMVVVLFAESRDALLPRDNPIYHSAYSLAGLRDQLERMTEHRRRSSYGAWPRMVSLFRLVHDGSSHEALTVPTYGGQLFEPGDAASSDGVSRALAVLENGCFDHDVMTDMQVYRILDLLSRTKIKIRQGRLSTWVPAPVDFSSLDNEYIGILYEGLLDFELRQATAANPIIFLAVGNQPALPLATLESMDDKALKNLLEKMKDTSSGSDEDGEDDGEESEGDEATGDSDGQPTSEVSDDSAAAEGPDDDVADAVESDDTAAEGDGDDRHTIRSRAEAWAQRAIAAGGLVTKPRGKLTEEKKLQYQAALDSKARQIITKVVLPGEWYLVRWGGTRKGSGTYYTRPQLAIPTVHRTLRPLAYDPPVGADGQPDEDAPIEQWVPKRPEQILNLKVCDPACGSGSFLLASLRFLTEALYASLHYHKRFQHFADRTVIDIIRDAANEQTLTDEKLPCRPEDADFEHRTKAVLRRYVVERCIYGVDLDPLAVELCRLSLWIETLDPRLPFTFLDHKIKCGNSLIGTWFDQFMHYPAMAWMREGGDKNHSNGVHFKKEAWTKAIKEKVADVRRELIEYIDGGSLLNQVDLTSVQTVHDDAERALQAIHSLGIHEVDQRADLYRQLRNSEAFIALKDAFDLWCAIWFWPPEEIASCPLPLDYYEDNIPDEARQISQRVATTMRFFHWELEFPDVFRQEALGFNAIVGNPPWDIAKPSSKEFFSAIDPLYRSYGKQEAIRRQITEFQCNCDTELNWLTYNAVFRAQSHWAKFVGHSFGDRITTDSDDKDSHDLNLGDRGRSSLASGERRHQRWRQKREELTGYADAEHAFRYQGGGDINLYKMFLEQAHAILIDGGRFGVIVPSGIYSDHGTGDLRTLFLDHCRWQWLFGFENREKVFDIDSRFKFNPIVIQKGGQTASIHTTFMRRSLSDWESAEQFVTEYPRERVLQFSPISKAVLEIQSERDIEVLNRIYSNSVLLGSEAENAWGVEYGRELEMTSDSKLFPPLEKWVEEGFLPSDYSTWKDMHGNVAVPLYEGRMIDQFDFSSTRWIRGKGRSAVWEAISFDKKSIGPQFLMSALKAAGSAQVRHSSKFAIMRVSSSTNTRTTIAAFIPEFPAQHSLFTGVTTNTPSSGSIIITAILNSLCFDYVVRQKCAGVNVTASVLNESPLPAKHWLSESCAGQALAVESARLMLIDPRFAPCWLCLGSVAEEAALANATSRVALTPHERLRTRVILDAVISVLYGLSLADMQWILRDCDLPMAELGQHRIASSLPPRGFWRVDKNRPPEHRQTVLTIAASTWLHEHIATEGTSEAGLHAFFAQNDGEGWQLPETLRLADYGLGHDERANEHQPVRACFGPRFYDWQLEQSPEQSWQECHLHARNLLGPTGYQALLDELSGRTVAATPPATASRSNQSSQGRLFDE